jgi:hypothetical protein
MGKEPALLDDITHLSPHLEHRFGGNALTIELNSPGVAGKKTDNQTENRRLAASAGTEEDGCAAYIKHQIERLYSRDMIEGFRYVV